MSKSFFILIPLISFSVSPCFAQQTTISISGNVRDTLRNEPLYRAVVELIYAKDSLMFKSALTDSLGKFHFDNVPNNQFLLRVSFLNYYTKISGIYFIDKLNGNADVQLKVKSAILNEVIVKSRLPVISFDGDKMIIDPQKISGVASISTLDLMKNMPGVIIENENKLTLNGNSDVIILIDDRKRTMTLDQALRLLKTIPASNIKQVEIITVKSARFDASGSGGIINIVTKKPIANGYNLQITNQLILDRYLSISENVYFNQRSNSITVYASAGFERSNSYSSRYSSSIYNTGFSTITANDIGDNRSSSNAPYFDIGIDFEIRPKKIISFAGSIYGEKSNSESQLLSFIEQPSKLAIKNLNTQASRERLGSFDANYSVKYDSLGSKLKLSIGYLSGFSKPNPNFSIYYLDEGGQNLKPPSNIIASLPLNGFQFIYQGDFDKIFDKKNTLSLGFKYTNGSILNDIRYDSIINSNIIEDVKRSDNLRYDERVAAGYITYKYKASKKINFLFGLRFESTQMKNVSYKLDSSNIRTFNNFFPSLSLSYNGTKIKSTLSFNRSISRPYYGFLNPYITYIDEFTYQVGNANLSPGYTYTINLNNSISNFIYVSSGISLAKDMVFLYKRLQNGSLQTIITPENALSYSSAYISASIPFSFYKEAWEGQFRLYGFAYKTQMNPDFFTSDLDLRLLGRYVISSSHTIRLYKSLYGETAISFYSKSLNNQSEIAKRWQMDIGFQKKIRKDAVTISLYFTDLFYTMTQTSKRYYDGYESFGYFGYNTQRARFSIILNMGKLQEDFSKSTSTKKEAERFKNL
jgi:ferric enterobactin receptor